MKIFAVTLRTTVRRYNATTGKTRQKWDYAITLYFDAPPSAADLLAVLDDPSLGGMDRMSLEKAAPFLKERPAIAVPSMEGVDCTTMPRQTFRSIPGTQDCEETLFTQEARIDPLRILTIREH